MHAKTAPHLQTTLAKRVADDFKAVNQLIIDRLSGDPMLIKQVGEHIIDSGGKRIRPLLVLLCHKAIQGTSPLNIKLAAVIEFIHTITLLHDDVVDESKQRRGQQTANVIWGNQASILVGDFLYSRTFEMMTELGEMDILKMLAKTTNDIARGEVIQLMHRNCPTLTLRQYETIIAGKTASLFEAACALTGLINQAPLKQRSALSQYGHHLGMAFQIIDDMMDYSSHAQAMGKNIGDDLAEGKVTLPLIYALQCANTTQRTCIERAIKTPRPEHLTPVTEIIRATDALARTHKTACAHIKTAQAALTSLKATSHRRDLLSLAEFVVSRDF